MRRAVLLAGRLAVIVLLTIVLASCWTLRTESPATNYVTANLTSADGNPYRAQNLVFGVGACSPYPRVFTGGGDGTNLSLRIDRSDLNYPSCSNGLQPMAFPNLVRVTKSHAVTADQIIRSPGRVTLSVNGDTSRVADGDRWDFMVNIWFAPNATHSCGNGGCEELMLWLDGGNQGPCCGPPVCDNCAVGGHVFDIYTGATPGFTMAFQPPRTAILGFDLRPFVQRAVQLGIVPGSWVLNNVSTGFELWRGGAGLRFQNLAVCVAGRGC